MKIFDRIESQVQCHARSFPTVIHKFNGKHLYNLQDNPVHNADGSDKLVADALTA